MKGLTLVLLCFLLPVTLLSAQDNPKDTRNYRLPGGHDFFGYTASDPGNMQLFYMADSGSVTMINPELFRWIYAKYHSLRILFPGDMLVWASAIDAQGNETADRVTILRAGNNATGRFRELDICSDADDITLVDLSPDGRKILYKVLYPGHCILKVSDWNGRITEFPRYQEFDQYNVVLWLNNEEILVQGDNAVLVWNLKQDTVKTLLNGFTLNRVFGISPDGRVLFRDSDGKSGVLDTATQRERVDYLPDHGKGYYKWSPDGKSLYFFQRRDDNNQDLYLYDPQKKDWRYIQTLGEYFFPMGFLRRGTAYLFYEDDHHNSTIGGYPIWMLILKTGKMINLSEQTGHYWAGFMACPHLYYLEGQEWVLDSEVLGKSSSKDREGRDYKKVSRERIVNGFLHIRIEENLYETTWLDSVALVAGETRILPEGCPAELNATDGQYLPLRMNDSVELRFPVPVGGEGELVLEFAGYYEPGP